MTEIIVTVCITVFGGVVWLIKSLFGNRISKLEDEKGAYIEVTKSDFEADNSVAGSDLDDRVLDEFGDR